MLEMFYYEENVFVEKTTGYANCKKKKLDFVLPLSLYNIMGNVKITVMCVCVYVF